MTVLRLFVIFGYKSAPNRQRSLRSSSPSCSVLCSFALAKNFSHSALFVFRDLRTLSFFGYQLSFVLPTTCALFRKKRGVGGTSNQSFSPPSRLQPPINKYRRADFGCLSTVGFQLTPFPSSLTQKQGGRGHWPALSAVEGSYQLSSLLDALPSLRSALCALCVSAVSLLFFPSPLLSPPPCPTSPFPLKWGHPFPVITGENQ